MLLLVFCIHQKQVTVHSYTKEDMKILSAGVKVCRHIFQTLQVYSKYRLSLEMYPNSILHCEAVPSCFGLSISPF